MDELRMLPVLKAIEKSVANAGIPKMENIVFVCVQHLLFTSVNLFESLIRLGAKPDNIFLIGKHYSTCPIVVTKISEMGIKLHELTPLERLGEYTTVFKQDVSNMWLQVQKHIHSNSIEGVIVLDDGGRCLEFIAQGILNEVPVIGIEQTTAGLFNPIVQNLPVPFIDVAACAAKIHLESTMIVDSILSHLDRYLPKEESILCGVVGLGVIGNVVAKKLMSKGYQVILYDVDKNKSHNILSASVVDSIDEIVSKSDYIFGCTGRDITASLDYTHVINKDKVFISCTSEDKEFLSLLKYIQNHIDSTKILDPLLDIKWAFNNKATITVLKGGFPINFDNSGESVPAQDIQLTRGLLLIALIQALFSLKSLTDKQEKGRIMLHPILQRFIVQEWFDCKGYYHLSTDLIEKFNEIAWIKDNSGGLLYDDTNLVNCFYPKMKQSALAEQLIA